VRGLTFEQRISPTKDANWELVAVDLKTTGPVPPVTMDEENLSLMISGVFSGMVEATESSLAIKCPDKACLGS